jgi:anti-anti-sigma factor
MFRLYSMPERAKLSENPIRDPGTIQDMETPMSPAPETPFRHLRSTTEGDVLVLSIIDSQLQDEQVAANLLQELLQQVDQHAARKVVVDFQRLKYMSSVAFRPFLTLRRTLREAGGRLVICSLSNAVGDIFYTTRLISDAGSMAAPFEMAPDVTTAVARLNNPGSGSRPEI